MSIKVRRSAGSFSPLELWLDRAGIKRRDPAGDLRAFAEGQAFKVFCLTWTLGRTRTRNIRGTEIFVAKGGWLHIAPGAQPTWVSSLTKERVAVPAQAALARSERTIYFKNQAAFKVVTAEGEHDIAIRRIDEDLVRMALVTAVPA